MLAASRPRFAPCRMEETRRRGWRQDTASRSTRVQRQARFRTFRHFLWFRFCFPVRCSALLSRPGKNNHRTRQGDLVYANRTFADERGTVRA